jgi:hypothetical protein
MEACTGALKSTIYKMEFYMFDLKNKQGNNSNDSVDDDAWKSQAFINIYLPSDSKSGRTKLGVMNLKVAKAAEKYLIDLCQKGGAEALEIVKNNIILDFQMADAPANRGLILEGVDSVKDSKAVG